jgi:hypothetical protein
VVLHIHHDARSLVVLGDEKAVHEELETLKRLLPTPDKTLGFISPDLEDQVPVTKLFLDFHDESEVPENRIQDFFRGLVHCSGEEESQFWVREAA